MVHYNKKIKNSFFETKLEIYVKMNIEINLEAISKGL